MASIWPSMHSASSSCSPLARTKRIAVVLLVTNDRVERGDLTVRDGFWLSYPTLPKLATSGSRPDHDLSEFLACEHLPRT